MSKDYYTVKDIAEELQVKEKAISHLINTGQLPASKLLNKWIVIVDDLNGLYLLNKRVYRVVVYINAFFNICCVICMFYIFAADLIGKAVE